MHRVAEAHRGHQPQIGAAQGQHVLLFLALRLRHDDDRAVAAGVADQRQADTGIAGGALDDDPARPQQAALLGVLDNVEGGAVLDRAAGIEELGLAEDRAPRRLRGTAQLDQRGVADRLDKPVAYVHASPPSGGAFVRCKRQHYRAVVIKGKPLLRLAPGFPLRAGWLRKSVPLAAEDLHDMTEAEAGELFPTPETDVLRPSSRGRNFFRSTGVWPWQFRSG